MSVFNKYIMQHMLTYGILNYNDGIELLDKCADKLNEDRKDLKHLVEEINEKILNLHFRIDIRLCEVTGEKFCIFVNTKNDKLQSAKNPADSEYFLILLTNIMKSEAKRISTIICLNLSSEMSNRISKDIAQSSIDQWTENGYLVKDEGFVYLGPRTISEFENYCKSQFTERMIRCCLCTGYVYFGKICGECSEVLHKHCSERYFKKNQICPNCKREWQEAEGRCYDTTQQSESDNEELNKTESMADSD